MSPEYIAIGALIVIVLGINGLVSSDTESVTRLSSNTRKSSLEIPKAGEVDWDREPPDTRHPSDSSQDGVDRREETWDTGDESTSRDDNNESNTPQDNSIDYSDMEFQWRTQTDVSFEDIGGMNETKHELRRDIINPLTTGKEKADEFGISVPNLLFHGPPGTGKTYMAKALATELGLPFTKLSGAHIQTKWINESAQKVNQLFTEAEQVAAKEGGAVVFIDELDSVLRDRDDATNAHAEDQKVVNEFLNQLQDLDDYDIVFIGATNRVDILDSAGMRAGRIDKKIEIGLPDKHARRSVIEHHVTDRPSDVDARIIDNIADVTEGWNAADLEALVERAAKIALFDRDASKITGHDLATAYRDHAEE